jgi:hypothetical protein
VFKKEGIMIKTTRNHYDESNKEKSLEEVLNAIVNRHGTLLFITSENYGDGEVGYTIVYEDNL